MIDRSVFRKSADGFTLVEMAVVVVIIAAVLTMGLGAMTSLMSSTSNSETRKREDVIRDALVAYLGANKQLPCPDVPNNTAGGADTSGVTGTEDRAGGLITGSCTSDFGVIPYATLGLGKNIAIDSWGNFLSYKVSTAATMPINCPGVTSDWTLSACYGAGKTGRFSVREGTTSTYSVYGTNIIAVVISHGPNGLGAYTQQAFQNSAPVTCEEGHNAPTASVAGCSLTADVFYKGDTAANDDIVSSITRDEAINALVKSGTLKSAAGVVADDLMSLRNSYLAAKATGTCSAVPVSVTPYDPWGSLYQVTPSVSFPVCICSKGGTGTILPCGAPQTLPTACAQINAADVTVLRLPMGLPACS